MVFIRLLFLAFFFWKQSHFEIIHGPRWPITNGALREYIAKITTLIIIKCVFLGCCNYNHHRKTLNLLPDEAFFEISRQRGKGYQPAADQTIAPNNSGARHSEDEIHKLNNPVWGTQKTKLTNQTERAAGLRAVLMLSTPAAGYLKKRKMASRPSAIKSNESNGV